MGNNLIGEPGNVVQAGTIHGSVTMQPHCATHLATFLQAVGHLGAGSNPYEQLAALAVIDELLTEIPSLKKPTIDILSLWIDAHPPDVNEGLLRAYKRVLEGVCYLTIKLYGVKMEPATALPARSR